MSSSDLDTMEIIGDRGKESGLKSQSAIRQNSKNNVHPSFQLEAQDNKQQGKHAQHQSEVDDPRTFDQEKKSGQQIFTVTKVTTNPKNRLTTMYENIKS